jgi:hypothetical protein
MRELPVDSDRFGGQFLLLQVPGVTSNATKGLCISTETTSISMRRGPGGRGLSLRGSESVGLGLGPESAARPGLAGRTRPGPGIYQGSSHEYFKFRPGALPPRLRVTSLSRYSSEADRP